MWGGRALNLVFLIQCLCIHLRYVWCGLKYQKGPSVFVILKKRGIVNSQRFSALRHRCWIYEWVIHTHIHCIPPSARIHLLLFFYFIFWRIKCKTNYGFKWMFVWMQFLLKLFQMVTKWLICIKLDILVQKYVACHFKAAHPVFYWNNYGFKCVVILEVL